MRRDDSRPFTHLSKDVGRRALAVSPQKKPHLLCPQARRLPTGSEPFYLLLRGEVRDSLPHKLVSNRLSASFVGVHLCSLSLHSHRHLIKYNIQRERDSTPTNSTRRIDPPPHTHTRRESKPHKHPFLPAHPTSPQHRPPPPHPPSHTHLRVSKRLSEASAMFTCCIIW